MLKTLLNKGVQKSSISGLNYVANSENIYVMDNHLAAIWCWDKLPKDKNYTIIHIDAHYDFGASPPDTFMYGDIDLTSTAIEDLASFKHSSGYQYFMWDNYIHLFNDKYPNLINEFISITQRLGHNYTPENIGFEEFDIWHLDCNILHEVDNYKILNIDIDYFFMQGSDCFEIFSDDIIDFFSNWLLENRYKFDQITIALSPECCGSWDNALRMVNRVLKPLNLEVAL